MRILAVAEFFPWPATNGGLIRLSTALEALAELGDLDLLVLHDERKPDPVVPSTVPIRRVRTTGYPAAGWLRWRVRWALRRGVPLQVALRSADPGPAADFASAAAEPYDLIWFSSARVFHWMGRPHVAPTVVDFIDLEDVKERQRADLIRRRSVTGPAAHVHRHLAQIQTRVNAWDWTRMQRSVADRADLVLLCSDEDVGRLGAPNAEVVVNTYPKPVRPVGRQSSGRQMTLLFPATFDYEPNADGARWMASELAPLIRSSVPGAQVRLVGLATPGVRVLDDPPDIRVVGRVPDMSVELARADAVVVPVRFGSGTRLKILEAFAHRVPVVSTTIGAEGLGVEHGVHLLLADDPKEFAQACSRIWSSPALRQRLVDAAEGLYLDRFTSATAKGRVQDLARRTSGPAPSGPHLG